ncbi:MAG: hypothetical protein IH949_00415 [Bacteroidetes bacterium]|nr:hypothetical protein [Bacteroidota bacterium]
MTEKENIDQLKKNVSSDFNKFEEFSLLRDSDINTLEEFKLFLTKKLSDLMVKNFDEVLNILYQIDINESKVRDVIQSNNNYKASLLADLIIERQLQKVKTRGKYKRNSTKDLLD